MARIRSRVMVGREADLAALREVVDGAARGRPGLAIVTGEAGIGKSRLVRELIDTLDDVLVLVGRGVGLASGELPFGVVSDTLADLLRRRPDVLTAEERIQLRQLLPGGRAEGTTDQARLLTRVVALIDRLAEQELVCWVVEDLQWVDAATRDVVNILGRRAGGRLAVIATARTAAPGEIDDAASYVEDLVRIPGARRVALRRLSTPEVQRQLADLLDEPLPPGAAQRIVEIGDGIPFVVEELAAAQGRPELSTAAAVAAARLGSLSGAARRLVEAAAVGDGHLVWPLLDTVLDLSPEELDEALVEAVRNGILEETPGRDGCRFRHALLRDAADRTIPPATRRAWHRRWAEAIESHPGVVAPDPALIAAAHHWHVAGDPEKAALAAAAAAPAARRTGSGADEHALWTRLLDLWPKASHVLEEVGIDHHTIVAFIVRISMAAGTGATRYIDQVEAHAIDEIERTLCGLWRHGIRYGKAFDPAAWTGTHLEASEKMLRAALPDPLAQMALMVAAGFTATDDPRGDGILTELEQLARDAGDSHTELICAKLLSLRLFMRGQTEASIERLAATLASVEDVSLFQLWLADGNQIWSLAQLGRYDEAQAVFDRALARASDPVMLGDPFDHIAENVCHVWICTGQWERAEELVRSAKPYWSAGPHCSDVYLAEIELLRTGCLSDVDGWTAAFAEPRPGGPDPDWIAETIAWHHGCAGDLEAMRRALAPVWDAAHPSATNELWNPLVRTARIEVDAAVRRPDPTDRSSAAVHLARLWEVGGMLNRRGPVGRAWTAELSAQLARFGGESCRSLFGNAVAAWEELGHPYDAAYARLCLAEAELADGDREAARHSADVALTVARGLGAGPLAGAAEEFLVRYRLGSRVVEEPGSVGSLTAREHEVLDLLAEGRTNLQIAAELYMSPKTASVHVSRIISKLGASNRTEAAAVARRAGLL